jgi:hypothetical protein
MNNQVTFEPAASAVTISRLTDGTAGHWKYIVDNVIVYRVEGTLTRSSPLHVDCFRSERYSKPFLPATASAACSPLASQLSPVHPLLSPSHPAQHPPPPNRSPQKD